MSAQAVSPDTPLVGRKDELLVLLEALRDAEDGTPACVAVVGEAGIGKTRLLDELVARAGPAALVLRGAAVASEQQVPFALMIDAVAPRLTQAESHPSYDTVQALLDELAAERPILLALDDVHWGDDASLELLARLSSRGFDQRISLVLAFRAHAAPTLLTNVVQLAARSESLRSVELGPLTLEEAAEFLGPGIDSVVRRRLYEDGGGNPFYLEQLGRTPALEATRDPAPLNESDDAPRCSVPTGVLDSLAQELKSASSAARTLLEGAAVVGEPFQYEVAAEVAALDEAAAPRALGELVEAGLVRGTSTPQRFVFRQPIIARAAYEASGEGWRLGAHERAAWALTRRGDPPWIVAHHVERSASQGDPVAIALLSEAGRAGLARAPRTAARYLRAALALIHEDRGAEAQRVGLLLALARAEVATGSLEQARTTLSEAIPALPDRASADHVTVASLLAEIESFLGDRDEATALLEDTLAGTDDRQVCERAVVMLELSAGRMRDGHRNEAARRAVQALRSAEQAGDRLVRAAAAAQLADIEQARGAIASARAQAARAAELIDELPNLTLAGRLSSMVHLASAEVALGEYATAAEHAHRALAVARETGQALLTVPLRMRLGTAQLWLGQLPEAARTAESMLETSRTLKLDHCLLWAWTLMARVAIHRGDHGATNAAENGVAHGQTVRHTTFMPFSHCVLGEAFLASGQPRRAHAAILSHGGGPELPLLEASSRPQWHAALTEVELAMGHLQGARACAEHARQAASDLGLPVQQSLAARAEALALIADGRPAGAVTLAAAAADVLARHGAIVEQARTVTVLGRAYAGIGASDRAVTALERAYADLDRCGARRGRDESARELRRLGHHVPHPDRRRLPPSGDDMSALSGRERDVAELAARGRTNREIGSALFVSEKTVERHMSHIFEKLHVSSRAEVGRDIGRAAEPDL
jgi:DNA-binding CsgD family transcriptional regulator/tetratricopeptide (TPR) repeat protein